MKRSLSPSRRPTRLTLEALEDRSLLSAAPTLELPDLRVNTSAYSDSHVLVRFRDAAHPAALPGTALGDALDLVPGLYQVDLSAGTSVTDALAAYRADASVLTAEPDYQLAASWLPNDSRLGDQYNMVNTGQNGGTPGADINANSAWGVTTGTRRTVVAVIDSGIDYTHPDLYLNIWINQGEIPPSRRANLTDVDKDGLITFVDLNNPINKGPGKVTDINRNGFIDGADVLAPMVKDASGKDTGLGGWADGISNEKDQWVDDIVGWNSNANNNNPMDGYGHGTHSAGTIGAVGNNGIGTAGVNWQVQLAAVKFFDDKGLGSVSQFIAGLDWVLAKGIHISNNSWVDSGYTPSLFEAVKRARDKGHIFVAAAGNNARNTDMQPVYPADFDLANVISVGATDRTGQLAKFSNYGVKSVDIVAPGVDVVSTNPGKVWGPRSGTSMATPHVTGVIALVWGLRPEWNYSQVINWVLQTAKRLPALTGKVASGMLDAGAAVRVPPRGTVVAPRPTATSLAAGAAVASQLAGLTAVWTTPSQGAQPQPAGAATPTAETAPATQVIDELFSALSLQLKSRSGRDEAAPAWWDEEKGWASGPA